MNKKYKLPAHRVLRAGEFMAFYNPINRKHIDVKIKSSKETFEFLNTHGYYDELTISNKEIFYLIGFSRSMMITCVSEISIGTDTATIVDVQEIIRILLWNRCKTYTLVHNHPSGNSQPSHNDKILTSKMRKAAELFDIPITDHIIVCENKYFSFADEDILKG